MNRSKQTGMARKTMVVFTDRFGCRFSPFRSGAAAEEGPVDWFALRPESFSNAAGYEAFRQGLRECGYAEGQNILVEYRWAKVKTIASLV
jgi:hypothetical protein